IAAIDRPRPTAVSKRTRQGGAQVLIVDGDLLVEREQHHRLKPTLACPGAAVKTRISSRPAVIVENHGEELSPIVVIGGAAVQDQLGVPVHAAEVEAAG